jgi:hypothetical protein
MPNDGLLVVAGRLTEGQRPHGEALARHGRQKTTFHIANVLASMCLLPCVCFNVFASMCFASMCFASMC